MSGLQRLKYAAMKGRSSRREFTAGAGLVGGILNFFTNWASNGKIAHKQTDFQDLRHIVAATKTRIAPEGLFVQFKVVKQMWIVKPNKSSVSALQHIVTRWKKCNCNLLLHVKSRIFLKPVSLYKQDFAKGEGSTPVCKMPKWSVHIFIEKTTNCVDNKRITRLVHLNGCQTLLLPGFLVNQCLGHRISSFLETLLREITEVWTKVGGKVLEFQ